MTETPEEREMGMSKNFVILRKPGCVPQIKRPLGDDDAALDTLVRELTLYYPNNDIIVVQIKEGNIWADNALDYLQEYIPLFIPLKTEYYEQFRSGEKIEELRLYGRKWNEKTCRVGRTVTLSKGYGKKERIKGRITGFKVQLGHTFGSTYQKAIMDVYGRLDVEIACIGIKVL